MTVSIGLMVRFNSKKGLYYFFLIVLLFISACTTQTCKEPYLEYKKGDCCLDSNSNGICDNDETNLQNLATGEQVDKMTEKPQCPYECCLDDEFNKKLCDGGFGCTQNKCIELDFDSDGLSDLLEENLGTNSKLADSDGDGLNDAVEVNVKKTNPLNSNSDSDRYNDLEDENPLLADSANILVQAERVDNPGLDLELITSSAIALGSVSLGNVAGISGGMILLNDLWDYVKQSDVRIIKFTITNEGEDYSQYVKFDLHIRYGYKKGDTLVDERNIFLKTYNVQEKIESHSSLEKADVFSLKELEKYIDEKFPKPEECQGLYTFLCDNFAEYNIQNIEYESYE